MFLCDPLKCMKQTREWSEEKRNEQNNNINAKQIINLQLLNHEINIYVCVKLNWFDGCTTVPLAALQTSNICIISSVHHIRQFSCDVCLSDKPIVKWQGSVEHKTRVLLRQLLVRFFLSQSIHFLVKILFNCWVVVAECMN